MSSQTPLSPFEELQIATNVTASFQTAIQQADAKGGILVAMYAGVVAVAATGNADLVRALWRGSHFSTGPAALLWVTLGLFVLGTLGCGAFLFQAIRPRLTPPAGANRFAFPTVAISVPMARPAVPDQLIAEAWGHAEAMAVIALAKYRNIRSALYCLPAMVLPAVPLIWVLPS
ncbi:hypothetical protein ACN265_32065 [Micromonospora sp. WMMD730]|uniref:hypothetical protein n=1 Tax=Micromonospora sp. WMMD730 TaxID=3404128 RepID=UPI003B9634CD